MGRPPKPVEQLIQEGTYRPDRHSGRGVVIEKIFRLEPPKELTQKAKATWQKIVPPLCAAGLVSTVDEPELIEAFTHYGIAQDCIQFVRDNYSTITEYMRAVNPRTEVSLINEYDKHMNAYKEIMRKFGTTPVERAKMRLPQKTEETDEDAAIKEIMGNG